MPNPLYIYTQNKLSWTVRGILIDWIIQVHLDFHLLPEILFLAINIIDRFLPTCTISLAKLQLVGITCLFIASKVEEIMSPSITHCARGWIPRLSDGMGTDKTEGKMTLCGYASGQTTKRSPRDNC